MILIKMTTIDRLIKIACYYNSIKPIEFHRDYANNRIKDSRAIVYHLLIKKYNYTIKDVAKIFNKTDVSIFEISENFNKPESYIFELLEHHNSEYNIINHYTSMCENVETQLDAWNKTDLDLQYSITKTKYDTDLAEKYEVILNENYKLKYELEKLRIKKNKYYV